MAGYYSTTLDVYNASHSTKRGELAVSWWDPLTTNSIVAGDTLWGDIEFTPIGSNAVYYYLDIGVLDDNGVFVSLGNGSTTPSQNAGSFPYYSMTTCKPNKTYTYSFSIQTPVLALTERINPIRIVFWSFDGVATAPPTISSTGLISGAGVLRCDQRGLTAAPSVNVNYLMSRVAPTFDFTLGGTTVGRLGSSFLGGYVQDKTVFTGTIDNIVFDPGNTYANILYPMTITFGTGADAQTFNMRSNTTGEPYEDMEIGTLSLSGTNIPYSVVVTDSTGTQSTAVTGTVDILPYAAPQITTLFAQRYIQNADLSYSPSVNGSNLWLDIATQVQALDGYNAWSLAVDYADESQTTTGTVSVSSGTDGSGFSVYETQRDPLTATTVLVSAGSPITFAVGNSWTLSAVLTDFFASTTLQVTVNRGIFRFDVTKYGVAVGMVSGGTVNDKRFEVADDYTAHFYGPIRAHGGLTDGSGNPLGAESFDATSGEVATGGTWTDSDGTKPIYKQIFTSTGAHTSFGSIGTITDLDKLISINGYVKTTANWLPIWYSAGNTYASARVSSAGAVNVVFTGSGTPTFVVVVYYTKV